VYAPYPSFAQVHTLKLEALESIVNESGGAQILVAYGFKSDLARILKAIRGASRRRAPGQHGPRARRDARQLLDSGLFRLHLEVGRP
jgi:hypothetical protein